MSGRIILATSIIYLHASTVIGALGMLANTSHMAGSTVGIAACPPWPVCANALHANNIKTTAFGIAFDMRIFLWSRGSADATSAE